MKKLILYGLAGALSMLLAQSPLDLQAMDSGIVSSDGYCGNNMGPGMKRYGDYQNYGMGPGMMSPGNEYGSLYGKSDTNLDQKDVKRILKDYLQSRYNPNLKFGEIKDEGSFFEAELLTKDNSLVDKLIVDKDTGRIRSVY